MGRVNISEVEKAVIHTLWEVGKTQKIAIKVGCSPHAIQNSSTAVPKSRQ